MLNWPTLAHLLFWYSCLNNIVDISEFFDNIYFQSEHYNSTVNSDRWGKVWKNFRNGLGKNSVAQTPLLRWLLYHLTLESHWISSVFPPLNQNILATNLKLRELGNVTIVFIHIIICYRLWNLFCGLEHKSKVKNVTC